MGFWGISQAANGAREMIQQNDEWGWRLLLVMMTVVVVMWFVVCLFALRK
jgi:Na+/melibiose symporter-like transporter